MEYQSWMKFNAHLSMNLANILDEQNILAVQINGFNKNSTGSLKCYKTTQKALIKNVPGFKDPR